MAITTLDGHTAARAAGRSLAIQKTSLANTAAGNITSLFRAVGVPTQPAIPTAAVVCDRTLLGALPLPAVSGANLRYIDALSLTSTIAGANTLADRVIHSGGLSGIVTTAQAVNTPAIPARILNAANLEWFLECYADLGATAAATTVVTVRYASAPATPVNITVPIPATLRAGRLLPITPATGQTIVSVDSVTIAPASTGTAGNFGVTALERAPLQAISAIANIGQNFEGLLRQIPADACLQVIQDSSNTASGDVRGYVVVIEG